MKYTSLITAAAGITLALAAAAPALADDNTTDTSGGVTAGVQVHTDVETGGKPPRPHLGLPGAGKFLASTTARFEGKGDHATSTQNRIDKGQQRGDNMIDQRIQSLNNLLARLSKMKLLSPDVLSALQASINTEISTLTTLKTQIGSDTSTTTVKSDDSDITKANRVYLVVIPKAQIAAAADRIDAVVTQLTALSTKLQTRITAAQTAGADVTAATAALTDYNAKVADAKTQADAAVSETVNLQADNGDATVRASNTTTLKDARTKLSAAEADLKAARADAKTIVDAVKGKGTTTP